MRTVVFTLVQCGGFLHDLYCRHRYFQFSDACVNVLSINVFFSLHFSFFDTFLFLKNFCSIKYVLLALFTIIWFVENL